MYKAFFSMIFLFGMILYSCKHSGRPSKENEKEMKEVSQKEAAGVDGISNGEKVDKEISFDIVKPFKEDTSENCFVNGDTKLTHKTGNSFILTKKDFAVTEVDFSGINYEGPGFTMYSYQSSQDKSKEVVIVEGQADIGTAWYYVIVLDGEDLADKFYIKEPRADTETTNLKDFLDISLKNKTLICEFKKDKIAKYSKVPEDLKNRGNYLYLEKTLN